MSDFNWHKGTYLHERGVRNLAAAGEQGMNQVRSWRQRTGLMPDEWFRQRLEQDGLDLAAFAAILQEQEEPCVRMKPSWPGALQEILKDSPTPAIHLEDLGLADREIPFFPFIRPFLHWARERFLHHPHPEWPTLSLATLSQSMVTALAKRLLKLAGFTLVYELNAARLNGELQAATREERFAEFARRYLTETGAIRLLLGKYPVLARLLAEEVQHVVSAHIEVLERFLADRDALVMLFGREFVQPVTLQADAGDRHNGGRSVVIVTFAAGGKLVYKPRSLAVEQHFQELLHWINARGFSPGFQTMRILTREQYGWQEFAHGLECRSAAEVERFYQRLGGYLALFYLLYAVDLHLENVIASGEHPMMVDLECLFHNGPELQQPLTAVQTVQNMLYHSVKRVLLLPGHLLKGFEASGIGGMARQKISTYAFADVGTDEMRMVKVTLESAAEKNVPVLNGEPVHPARYTEQLVDGFERMYRLLLTHRETLRAAESPLRAFAHDTVRVILRPTADYGAMLAASLHPDNLQDGLQRCQLFDFMWRAAEHRPALLQVIHAEYAAMLQGDVPAFYKEADGTGIHDGRGNTHPGFFHRSGLANTMELLERMGEADLARQTGLIRTSMRTITKSAFLVVPPRPAAVGPHLPLASQDELLQAAMRIGDYLAEKAVWGDRQESVAWIGLHKDGFSAQWGFSLIDPTLYQGTLGMALFFGYLYELTRDRRYREIAKASMRTTEERLAALNKSCSAYEGYAALTYTYHHLSVLLAEPELLGRGLAWLERLETLISRDRRLDYVGGCAGALIVSLQLHRLTGHELAKRVAVKCGEHLLRQAIQLPVGIGWRTMDDAEVTIPVSGFAHGNSGIACALAELAAVTGEQRFREAAIGAIQAERQCYDPASRNWLREVGDGDPRAAKWCWGSPGIALGRALLLRHFDDEQLRSELAIAVATTKERGFGFDRSLCHGDLGNLDVLLTVAALTNDEELREWTYRYVSQLLTLAENRQDAHESMLDTDVLGLMLGVAGVGYGFLRFAAPQRIPSVLSLETPLRQLERQSGGILA